LKRAANGRYFQLALFVLRILTFAAAAARWQAVVVVIQSDFPVAVGAAIRAFSGFLANTVHFGSPKM
jgi:hypothetical protein